jgi:hypothetical protein
MVEVWIGVARKHKRCRRPELGKEPLAAGAELGGCD